MKRNKGVFKNPTKDAFATCIAAARLNILDVDSKWIEKRKDEIWEENNMSRVSKESTFDQKVETELQSNFFTLLDTQTYKKYRDEQELHRYCFGNKEENKDVNGEATVSLDRSSHECNTMIFSDDGMTPLHSQPRTSRARRKGNNGRISFGGTDLMGDLASPV